MVVEFTQEKYDAVIKKLRKGRDKKFQEWLKSKMCFGFLFDAKTYWYCYKVSEKLQQDYDHFSVISGLEGTGKSTLTSLLAVIVSPTMSMGHVCYEPEDFIKALTIAKKGDTVWLDESALILFSRESMGKDNRKITKLFTICRQLNLHLIICIPNFFVIDSYVRDHRVSNLIHIFKRGFFINYNREAVRIISHIGKNHKNVSAVKVPNGKFYHGYYNKAFGEANDLTKEAYERKKTENMNAHLKNLWEEYEIDGAKKDDGTVKYIKVSEYRKYVPYSRDTVIRKIHSGDIPGKKIGGQWCVERSEIEGA